jgi:methanogenic corrinoid protein MtbC1
VGGGVNDLSSFLARGIPAEMVETFTHLLLSADGGEAVQLAERLAADGVPTEDLMLELLAPSARMMGEMWCGDELGFIEVTLGLSRLQQLMRQFRPPAARPGAERGAALLLAAPGEQHTFGLRIVEEFLLRDGWSVRLGLSGRVEDMLHLVAADPYDIVGFSISGERLLPGLRSAIREIRNASLNRDVKIMLGGPLVASNPNAACAAGADTLVSDVHEAVARVNHLSALAGVSG